MPAAMQLLLTHQDYTKASVSVCVCVSVSVPVCVCVSVCVCVCVSVIALAKNASSPDRSPPPLFFVCV